MLIIRGILIKNRKLILIFIIIILLSNTAVLGNKSNNLNKEESTIILVMGFGPFLNFSVNPSELIAAELDGEIINDAEIIGLQIQPNLSDFNESIEIAYQAIQDYDPQFIISIGLAAKYENIRIEKIGYNLKIETRENSSLETLNQNGPWIYLSPFPTNKIVEELRKENIPSQTGLFPGLSLCNGMLYSVLNYIDEYDLNINSGFIHVPLMKTEENPNEMELQTMINATKIIIEACLEFFT
jgi:pyroglutamyl-peptidase